MSSVPEAPVPIPPPPPAPPTKLFGSSQGKPVGKGLLLDKGGERQGGQGGGEEGSGGLLGQTEIREITEEKFLEELGELMRCRLVGTRSANEGEGGVGEHVKFAVATPLRKAMLQSGPMCGIVALAEALQVRTGEDVSPTVILEEAIKMGFTKQGEMFSVTAMQSLAEKFGKCQNSRIVQDANDKEQFTAVISHILQGCPILVPYDADYNHSPSLRKGHAAHWAVIYGIACIIPEEKATLINSACPEVFSLLKSSPEMIIVKPSTAVRNELTPSLLGELLELFTYESLCVIAHQGKSFHPALWSYKDLIESNQNLQQIAPKILASKTDFICEDIVDGLCSKILLLN